jgi:hypothetical protein
VRLLRQSLHRDARDFAIEHGVQVRRLQGCHMWMQGGEQLAKLAGVSHEADHAASREARRPQWLAFTPE